MPDRHTVISDETRQDMDTRDRAKTSRYSASTVTRKTMSWDKTRP